MHRIKITDLSKQIGEVQILDHVNCDLYGGRITGLIGNNGAGKTTFIKCLTSFYNDYTGRIECNNRMLRSQDVSYIPDSPVYYEELTFGEHIEFIAAINKSKERVKDYVDVFDVKPYLRKFPNELSKGTLQRMMIILALLRGKGTLIADEPFDGLDPGQVKVLKKELIRLKEEGMAILLSSHQLSLIQETCDAFIFMKDGRVVYTGDKGTNSHTIQTLYDDVIGGESSGV